MDKPNDIVITTNSPGELQSWVIGVVRELKQLSPQSRIILALVPCPFASGQEISVAKSIPGVELILTPKQTLLLWLGRFPAQYLPRKTGVVAFLGGDPMHALLLAHRLHYPAVAYASHYNFFFRFFLKLATPHNGVARQFAANGWLSRLVARRVKQQVQSIGNLGMDGVLAQVQRQAANANNSSINIFNNLNSSNNRTEQSADKIAESVMVGLFPGSRQLHLRVALAPFLRVAQLLHERVPSTRFLLAVSPFVDRACLQRALEQPLDIGLPGAQGQLVGGRLLLDDGLEVNVIWGQPYVAMAMLDVALCIPGTNTGEIACAGKPIVVGISAGSPFPRGGLGGLLEKMSFLKNLLNTLRRRSYQRMVFAALPNRLARRQVTPEVMVEEDLEALVEPLYRLVTDREQRLAVGRTLIEVMGDSHDAHRSFAQLILEAL